MSSAPQVTIATVTDTGGAVALGDQVDHLQISNDQAIAVRLYFNLADFNANQNYISIAATSGYYEGPDAVSPIYLKLASSGSQAVTVKWNGRKATTGLV